MEPNQPQHESVEAPPSDSKSNRSWVDGLRKLDKWWTVLLLLFCVMGALGIPVLWVSQAFNPWQKVVLTIVVTLYTAFLFWLVYLIWALAYQSVSDMI